MVTMQGFEGPVPHSIIIWQLSGEDQSKTICYSHEDEIAAIERMHSLGDFYNNYDKAIVIGVDDSIVEIQKHFSISA
ncbi:hypothetical protein ACFSO7_02795 [Bacillus sp. CGMCC 1.16607]|uniref:hypothetical protein n=1 Tax=Bacillus sp. CGMCC 1.16607 TaxID=3351842 RepID=UPI003638CE63